MARVSPIDSSRRELQNALGEIEIGDSFDFCRFLKFFGIPDGSGSIPDAPGCSLYRSQIGPGSIQDRSLIDPGSVKD